MLPLNLRSIVRDFPTLSPFETRAPAKVLSQSAAEAVRCVSQLNPCIVKKVLCCSGGCIDPAEEWGLRFGSVDESQHGVVFIAFPHK